MWLKNEIEEGIVTTEDLEEFAEMFKSGKYTKQEIMDWFGITTGKFKSWSKECQERGLVKNAKMDRCRTFRRRANKGSVRQSRMLAYLDELS